MPATDQATETELLDDAEQALALALAAGADDVVTGVSTGRSTEYSYRDGQIERVQESASRMLGVQLYVDGRYSAHQSNDLRPSVLKPFLREAVKLTRALEPDPYRTIPDPALYEGRSDVDLDLFDPAVEALDRDRCIEWLSKMDAASHTDERVISATSHLAMGAGASARVSSNGFRGARAGTRISAYTEVTVQGEGDKRPEAYDYGCARHLEDMRSHDAIAREALARAIGRIGAVKGASGRFTMVVDREAGASFLGRIFGALTASSIQQGRSFLEKQRDQTIAPALLTITDEPLIARGLGSHHYDGEGIAARPRAVIENGVLKSFYVDTYYGRKLGWEPTSGSASNLVFAHGEHDRDGILAAVGNGIYVTNWAGGNADATTGDFSFGIRGNRIVDGELGEAVGEMNITGNYLRMLGRLLHVGNDPYPCSAMRVPTMAFEGVQFSGA